MVARTQRGQELGQLLPKRSVTARDYSTHGFIGSIGHLLRFCERNCEKKKYGKCLRRKKDEAA
jgi:hypothetical protein